MSKLKYKVIRDHKQYFDYCKKLEHLVEQNPHKAGVQDEIDLLTLLIETYDEEQNGLDESDPIALLRALMEEKKMTAADLVRMLGISKSLVSEILNYKKGLSKASIRKLSAHFKVSQEAFNRPYKIEPKIIRNRKTKNSSKKGKSKKARAAA